MFGMEFYVDPSRCIGCQSCVKACEECDTHRGHSMINFDFIDRPENIGTPRTSAGIARTRPARKYALPMPSRKVKTALYSRR